MKTAYLIDHSNLAYRFRSTFQFARTTINNVEVDTSCLYGYIRTMKSHLFNDIFICLDGVPQRFFDILPGYKGQRLEDPNENRRVPFSEEIRFISALGKVYNKNIKVLASPGQEADQVMSSITHLNAGLGPANPVFYTKLYNNMQITLDNDPHLSKLSKGVTLSINEYNFDTTVLGTTDSDMYQLLQNGNVHIDSSTNGKKILPRTYTPKAVHSLPPACIPAYKMIVGDVSDNVPNLDLGISDKMLIELIKKELNSVDKIDSFINAVRLGTPVENKHLLSIQKKIREQNKVKAMLANREVTKLVYNCTPFELSYEDYDIKETLEKYKLKIPT